jgi:uncharacterized membrane protein YqiK
MGEIIPIAVAALALVVLTFVMLGRLIVRVPQGKALVVNRVRAEPTVHFSDTVVLPIVNRAELIDVSVVPITIVRRGRESIFCRDDERADMEVTFYLRVNPTAEDVLRVARSVGCARAATPEAMRQLFEARFTHAMQTVVRALTFAECLTERERLKDQIIQIVGSDLEGYVLSDLAIGTFDRASAEDPNIRVVVGEEGPAYRDAFAASKARVETLKQQLEEAEQMHDALAERTRK